MKVHWSAQVPGNLIEVEYRGSHLYVEGGRPDWPGRGHEGWGGSFTIEEVRRDPERVFGEFPGLFDEVMGDLTERHRVVDAPVAVIEALGEGTDPHQWEVPFVIDGDRLFVPLGANSIDEIDRAELVSLVTATSAVEVRVNGGESGAEWSALLTGDATVIHPESYWGEDLLALLVANYPNLEGDDHSSLVRVDITSWTPEVDARSVSRRSRQARP